MSRFKLVAGHSNSFNYSCQGGLVFMSANDSFLKNERKNIEKTVIMIEHLTEKTYLSKYEVLV